ncbi:type II secretion system protein [Clostridium perfringens]|uniref:type II secretion system protein n=1 Tax=Clostridium perfringens TaxID=1502 RepID=UPI0024BC76EC|nr:type II secretion system protein [Clostridium perfringens]EGT3606342.1 type II secretion system protein [Clostridium perfringens]
MLYMKKKKGASLAYVIVVLAIIATIGTAIVSLSLANYKAIIVDSKKTQNLYMSESGLDEAKVKINNLTSKAVEAGNDAVTKSSIENLTSENIESTQNEIFKKEYKKYIQNNLKSLFKIKDGHVLFNTKGFKYEKEDNYYDIELVSINNNKLELVNRINQLGDLDKNFIFELSGNKKSDKEILTLRLNSKFNVKDGNEIKNYKDVSLTFEIEVPDYNGAYYTEKIPVYNIWQQGLVVGENLNINQNSNLNINGSAYVSANYSFEDNKSYKNSSQNKNASGIVISGGDLSVDNGILVSKQDIILNGENGELKVLSSLGGNNGGVYTHNLGIYSFENLNSNKVFGNSETLEGNKIDTKVPVYTMNDLIMNGLNSTIKLQDGFYGINSNSGDKTLTGEKQNSSAIIINSKDLGNGSSLDIKNKAVIMGSAYINTLGESYQTGESLAVKGNYVAYTYAVKGKDVEFKYYNPLQLVERINGDSSLDAKAKYFKEASKSFNIKSNGIKLPSSDDVISVGVTVDGDNDIKGNNLILDDIKKIREEYVDNYFRKVNVVNTETTISREKKYTNKITKDNDLIYIDINNGANVLKNIENSPLKIKDKLITINKSCNGIIITDKDIKIDSSIDFKGTIITTGNLDVLNKDTAKKQNISITYDEEYLKELIGNNYEDFKGVFTGNPDSTYLLVKSEKDINDTTLDLVKTSNWEVN